MADDTDLDTREVEAMEAIAAHLSTISVALVVIAMWTFIICMVLILT